MDELNEQGKRFDPKLIGDYLAKREKYSVHKGLDAIHYYLVQKHHWPLSDVRNMSFEDIEFLLAEERKDELVPRIRSLA